MNRRLANWFGPESWGAPICAECPRCDTPVGSTCQRCDKPILEDDEGVTIPSWGGAPIAYHLRCHLKGVLPHPQWPSHNLVPEECDGLENGVFLCLTCGMAYSLADGWL